AQALTGFTEEKLLTQSFWELVAPKYQQLIKERGLSRLKGEWPQDKYELQIIQNNGDPKWVQIHMNRIELKEKPAIIVGAIDIDSKKKNELDLIRSRERYKILTNNLVEGIILLDEDYKVEFSNPSVNRTFKKTKEVIIGKKITQICYYEHRFHFIELLKNAKKDGFCVDEFDFNYESTLMLFEMHAKYIENERKFLVVMHNITDREMANKTEKKLVTLQNTFLKLVSEIVKTGMDEETYFRVLKMAIDIVPGVQAGSVLLRVGNEFRFAATIGYDFSVLKKISLKEEELLQTQDNEIGVIRNLKQRNEEKIGNDKAYALNTSGRTEEIKETLSIPIKIESKVVAFFNLDNLEEEAAITNDSIKIARLFSDVMTAIMQKSQYEKTLLKKNEELKKMSNYDPLTNLSNRRFLSENISRLFQEVREAGTILYMLYIDLNNFRSINDNYGHEMGDLLLAEFGKRIKERVRTMDMVSRIGGDEFLLIMTSLNKDDLEKFLIRFIKELKEPYFINSKKFCISSSIGISRFPADGGTFQELLKKADMAMYKAKKEKLSFTFYQEN
ncbi:MAG: sensor domain-containing diguanylate cyclase, partial [Thermotogota bacterium]|nr:sensor domain-containing diguanylate cyclase [Thermotogota bacterium]